MGKDGFLTAKAIGKRIKQKGLQKLRFYCQLCQKQCRDANGFKCHVESESHLKQMQLFGQDSSRYVDEYSQEFQSAFMDVLRTQYKYKKVLANHVYKEIVADKQHVHMNATHWTTLTEFVAHLGRSGLVHVEDTGEPQGRGLFIRYIDRDPAALQRAAAKARMEAADKTNEKQFLHQQMQAARALQPAAADDQQARATTLDRSAVPAVKLALQQRRPPAGSAVLAASADDDGDDGDDTGAERRLVGDRRKRSAPSSSSLHQLMQEETAAKRQRVEREQAEVRARQQGSESGATGRGRSAWLLPGIVVKIMNRDLAGGRYYKAKAEVRRVRADDPHVADVKVLDSHGHRLRLDDSQLETVVPQPGGRVLLLLGRHRGSPADVLSLNLASYSCDLLLVDDPDQRVLRDVVYEAFSKAVL